MWGIVLSVGGCHLLLTVTLYCNLHFTDGDWGTEKLSNFPKSTVLENGRDEILNPVNLAPETNPTTPRPLNHAKYHAPHTMYKQWLKYTFQREVPKNKPAKPSPSSSSKWTTTTTNQFKIKFIKCLSDKGGIMYKCYAFTTEGHFPILSWNASWCPGPVLCLQMVSVSQSLKLSGIYSQTLKPAQWQPPLSDELG